MNENNEFVQLLELLTKYTQNPGSKQKPFHKKLGHQEKIYFAQEYYNLTHLSLIEILKLAEDQYPELKEAIINFITANKLLQSYPNHRFEYKYPSNQNLTINPYLKHVKADTIAKKYDSQNWLEPFDEDAVFEENKVKHPTIHKFVMPNGELMVFDKEAAVKVKMALIEKSIFPAKCIVEGAYPNIAYGTFDEYIKTLKNI